MGCRKSYDNDYHDWDDVDWKRWSDIWPDDSIYYEDGEEYDHHCCDCTGCDDCYNCNSCHSEKRRG